MSYLTDKAGFAAQLHELVLADIGPEGRAGGMRVIQRLAGLLVETLLLFDDPDEGLSDSIDKLCVALGCEPTEGTLAEGILPPAHLIDQETEIGRAMARVLFEEWLECAYQFHDLLLFTTRHLLLCLEKEGHIRAETLRLFAECATRALAYEISAQELCDIIIDRKMGIENWSLSEGVVGLSAIAGRCLAMSGDAYGLDHVAYVMTQEAVRLGVPAGSDWRFGIAANDGPPSAPFDLIFNLWPACRDFFRAISLQGLTDQAAACAKAAGRMLAIASGGEMPSLEPVIAKPLAMMALTETYRAVAQSAMSLDERATELA